MQSEKGRIKIVAPKNRCNERSRQTRDRAFAPQDGFCRENIYEKTRQHDSWCGGILEGGLG